jgi:hypothetical protein
MAIPNLKAISDEELLTLRDAADPDAAPGSRLTRGESERVWNEIVRRRHLKNDPHFGQVIGQHKAEPNAGSEQEKPLDPRSEVSADAVFLWGRIWVWFWLLPAIAGVIWFLIERILK